MKKKILLISLFLCLPLLDLSAQDSVFYASGARFVRFYLINDSQWDTRSSQYVEYHYDKNGICRLAQKFDRRYSNKYRTGDTLYYNPKGYNLTVLSDNEKEQLKTDKKFKVYIDRDGNYYTKRPKLSSDFFMNIKEIELDSKGNWIHGLAFHKDDKEMKLSRNMIKRDIIYWGDNPQEDKSTEEYYADMDQYTDYSNMESERSSGKMSANFRDFRESVIGVIVFDALFPFIIVLIGFGLPLIFISAIPIIPNWVLTIIAFFFGVSFLGMALGGIGSGPFIGCILSGIVYIFATYGVFVGVMHQRCPKCHTSNSAIYSTVKNIVTFKKFRVGNGDKELIDQSSSADYDDYHACKNCGYRWKTNRAL